MMIKGEGDELPSNPVARSGLWRDIGSECLTGSPAAVCGVRGMAGHLAIWPSHHPLFSHSPLPVPASQQDVSIIGLRVYLGYPPLSYIYCDNCHPCLRAEAQLRLCLAESRSSLCRLFTRKKSKRWIFFRLFLGRT